jgi:hypothetical protein
MSTSTAPLIMVIRHAEKPADTPPPHGVNTDGDHDKESLIVQGWQRAGALAPYFAPTRGPLQYTQLAKPQVLFASGLSESKSERPVETITPLAQKAGLTIDDTYSKGDESEVANAAMGQKVPVLICWQHQDIPAIANAILKNSPDKAPQSWPDDRFDLVWVFTLQNGTYTFQQVPQMLLAGDSPDPITP